MIQGSCECCILHTAQLNAVNEKSGQSSQAYASLSFSSVLYRVLKLSLLPCPRKTRPVNRRRTLGRTKERRQPQANWICLNQQQ